MFKRVVWLGIGAAAGSASTVWTQRKIKAKVSRVAEKATPAHAAALARDRVIVIRDTVKAAVSEGREAQRSSESEMRRVIDDRWGPRVR